jgi:3'(2'), 5'-bisphosphate nucleotidase
MLNKKLKILTASQIEQIVDIAYEAGEIAKQYFFDKNFTQQKKSDGSCLTSVDLLLSDFIETNLKKITSQIPIICEENNLRNKQFDYFFLIDPIDGTSQFASGNWQFCINIALICNSLPVFGLIYAPLFKTSSQIGAMVYNYDKQLFVNNKPIRIAKKDIAKLNIIASPRASLTDIVKFIEIFYPKFVHNYSILPLGSAVKFVQLILEKENFYLNLRPSMAWDIAAGHCLLRTHDDNCLLTLCNNNFTKKTNLTNLQYNSKNLKNNYFFVDLQKI